MSIKLSQVSGDLEIDVDIEKSNTTTRNKIGSGEIEKLEQSTYRY